VVQLRILTVAQTVGADWLVERGIEAGDRVIVEGLQYARPGQKANAVPFEASPPPPPAADAAKS
jgi:membrane fusion protein (multidrug efflux system)